MPRALLLSCLLILGSARSLYSADPKPVGFVAEKEDAITGQLKGATSPLQKQAIVEEGMTVETRGTGSGALIPIGHEQGAVTMGQDSRIVFDKAILDPITGKSKELSFWTELGQFRFVFFSRPKGPLNRFKVASRQVKIKIFNPKSKAEIDLFGTDVQVHVAPDGAMSVFVAEGFVKVRKEKEVRVRAGEWTYVGLDGPPTPPRPFDRGTGGPGPGFQDWGIPPDPPSMENPRLDLPKAGPP